jgi:hypothetical protein
VGVSRESLGRRQEHIDQVRHPTVRRAPPLLVVVLVAADAAVCGESDALA